MDQTKKMELINLIELYADRKFFYGLAIDEKMADRCRKEAEQLEEKIKNIIENI